MSFIDREKLVEILKRKPLHTNYSPELAIQNNADYFLANDVVPVVRCKDCKKRRRNNTCNVCEMIVYDNDFCSYGVMKDGAGQ